MNVHIYRHRVIVGRETLEQAAMPIRQTAGAAAYDVQAFIPGKRSIEIAPMETVRVSTGIFVALPLDSVMLVCARSGLACKGVHVGNGPGIVDSDYRGEVQIILTYHAAPGTANYRIRHGDRIAQFLFLNKGGLAFPEFEDVDMESQLPAPESERTGGFGSTGV
jgi:dUTP pyrophosphatase